MKNSIIKLASSSLVALLLTGCYGITMTQNGNVTEGDASYLIHNQPLTVKSEIMHNSPQNVAPIGNEGNDNVSAQISGETQPSSTILEVSPQQDQTQQEAVADTFDSGIGGPVPNNEETPQIASSPEVGYQAPGFEIMQADGNSLQLCDFGTPVLLNFWNSGCKPCRDEMSYLQKVYDERRDEGLLVLAVNIGQSPTSIQSFMEDRNLHIPVLFDINAVLAQQYQIRFLPTSFFIDTDCTIQDKFIGSFPSAAAIEEKLANIISE